MRAARSLLVPALMLAGCAAGRTSVPPGSNLPTGHWGAAGVAMSVGPSGGQVDWACSSASFVGPLRIGVGGHYLVEGTVQRAPAANAEPANISGRVEADGSLWVDVAVRSGLVLRSRHLRRVKRPTVQPCR